MKQQYKIINMAKLVGRRFRIIVVISDTIFPILPTPPVKADASPPDTVIISGPSGVTTDSTPSFVFISSTDPVVFECAVDGNPYAACTSPYTTPPLADGPHIFSVRAKDFTDQTDPSAAQRAFIVVTSQIEINDCVELQKIGNDPGYPLSGNYVLGSDISCGATRPDNPDNASSPWNDGKGFSPIGPNDSSPFTGTFDGGNHYIDNLNIIRADDTPGIDTGTINQGADYQFVGLFGYANGATIQNLSLPYARVKGLYDVGGVVGYAENSTLSSLRVNDGFGSQTYNDGCSLGTYCIWARYGERGGGIVGTLDGGSLTDAHSGANVKGSGVIIGGLVGFATNESVISGSSSSAVIDGGTYVGGLVGQTEGMTIEDSSASGNVYAVYEWDYGKLGSSGGGLIGYANNTVLTNVSASGSVNGLQQIGGLVGVYFGPSAVATTVTASGNVNGQDLVGGMFGQAGCQSQVTGATASGAVVATGYSVGGFVGTDSCMGTGGTYTDAHATGIVSGDNSVGGFIGDGSVTTLNSSSATGQVSGVHYSVGGFAGRLYGSVVDNSSADGLVTGQDFIGGFVGSSGCGSVFSDSNAHGDVVATGSIVGGFSGGDGCEGPGSSMINLLATGAVSGVDNVGGLVGSAWYTQIDESAATGSITGSSDKVGGLVGALYGCGYDCDPASYIHTSFATGDVVTSGVQAGGLVGYIEGADIQDSYSRSDVVANSVAGGLVGAAVSNSRISRSFATGVPSGEISTGGLFGASVEDGLTVEYSFWDVESSGSTTGPAGAGKTTAEMKVASTYTTDLNAYAWDFDTVWNIDATKNAGYPCLRWSSVSCSTPQSGDNSVTFISPLTDKAIKLQLDEGCSFEALFKRELDNNAPNDVAYEYPNGLVGFNADCGQPGVTITVRQYYYGITSASVVLRKYNPATKTYFTITDAQIEQTTIDGQPVTRVTYQVTDGGLRDADGITDGKILDPAGLATNIIGVPNTGLSGKL